jgi:hypothetical protein
MFVEVQRGQVVGTTLMAAPPGVVRLGLPVREMGQMVLKVQQVSQLADPSHTGKLGNSPLQETLGCLILH